MTNLTELDILTSYDPMIRKTVYNFMRRCSVQTMSAEDLLQEARLAFLQHIRTHEPRDYGRCRLTILHALCDAVLRQYPLSMPRAVYLSKEKRAPLCIADFNKAEEAFALDDGCEAVDLMNEIMEAVESLPQEAMELVKLKLNGYSNREAARQLGMTDVRVSRMLKRIRRLLGEASKNKNGGGF